MNSVKRIYVEKKSPYAVKAKELQSEIRNYLGIEADSVRILIRYDVENISDSIFEKACTTVFSEPPVDTLYRENIEVPEGSRVFSISFLPGQFDQRADSAVQCIRFLDENETPIIRTAVTYIISGKISDDDFEKIRSYCINPVDSRETGMEKPATLEIKYNDPEDVKIFGGFRTMSDEDFRKLYDSLCLAMTYKDFEFIRSYFTDEEKRDPSMTEIRVLDTYWSDHCRHTTFSTELKNISFGDGYYKKPMEDTYNEYLGARKELYKGRDDKYVCLMDLAIIGMKKLRADGKLNDMEKSDENNACSVVVPIEVDRGNGPKEEEWLVFFKNETHNHPTEIEPFGGAATCLGGAIRDPLSGRGYVYQAMRITGAADPTAPVSQTLEGKLPQKKLVRGAAQGYSSYGNQIGLATGYVKELYHPDYVAKRMEIGAVMGAVPRANVRRENSDPGDIIILLGGRTGRDGCGGATGASKPHNSQSLEVCGAEVQKGNAPTERKLQRLFRHPEVSKIIKKCNDFGAGGVSVAIGELADGLDIDLDQVPKKYAGLDGTELAISESQERMAVVVEAKDADKFLEFAHNENLEAVKAAVVTKEPRLVLKWRGKKVVDISRAFLDTNGAHQENDAEVDAPVKEDDYFNKIAEPAVKSALDKGDVKGAWLSLLSDLNVCSQKGLVEMFDSSIGAESELMPYGGRYQLTETQVMAAGLPLLKGKTDTVTLMSYGFDPYLSSWSPYHGASYAVTVSLAKIAAAGGNCRKAHLTFQEYFRRMNEQPKRWSQPLAALLGAYAAQIGYGIAAIGGKDSSSGTFNELDVPPTLVSFAVDVDKAGHVLTPEMKMAQDKLVMIKLPKDEYDLPKYDVIMNLFDKITAFVDGGKAVASYVVEGSGAAAALSKMAFGNKMGFCIADGVSKEELFGNGTGNIILEVPADKMNDPLFAGIRDGVAISESAVCKTGALDAVVLGEVTDDGCFTYAGVKITIDEALDAWTKKLDKVFPYHSEQAKEAEAAGKGTCDAYGDPNGNAAVKSSIFKAKEIHVCAHKLAKPRVFIPVFPGTNCEYDSARAFERAGAEPLVKVFRNNSSEDIRDSVNEYIDAIKQSQIIMFPGGFSAGDEPDGSAKFFATAFQNQGIKDAVKGLLDERDGLVLGICNGFQALIKLGLVPSGKITGQNEQSPTLTFNTVGRHISKMVYTKVVSNLSPWLALAQPGGVYVDPASHGEGRFVAPKECIDTLFANGQVATQYCDPDGNVSMDEEWNVNGSYCAIEGITSPDGRILGKMAHVERRGDHVAINITGEQDMKVFEAGVKYFS